MKVKRRIAVVLLVEDNADDVFITARAFQRIEAWIDLRIVRDGKEALDYLMRREKYTDVPAPRPDIVLLDINLPQMTGIEVLRNIRANPGLATLPVVMLTGSDLQDNVELCYAAGANTFIRKPLEFEESLRTLEVLGEYWLGMARLPKAS